MKAKVAKLNLNSSTRMAPVCEIAKHLSDFVAADARDMVTIFNNGPFYQSFTESIHLSTLYIYLKYGHI